MRNVFDQYTQVENRVTHALVTGLNEDRDLLGSFLTDLIRIRPPVAPKKLSVIEQKYPGSTETPEDAPERRGIPDGWVYSVEASWCVLIENKVLASVSLDQIRRHRESAKRLGFRDITVVAILPSPRDLPLDDAVILQWKDVYGWLRRNVAKSMWARQVSHYLEIVEAKLIATNKFTEGALTAFAGFPFSHDHPFTYLEGKRLLTLALTELRGRTDLREMLGVDPALAGRGAITGQKEDRVWDFLSLAIRGGSGFTQFPHLTLGLDREAVEASVTIPHGTNTAMQTELTKLGEEGFFSLMSEIVDGWAPFLKCYPGAAPWFRGIQRRYPGQRATPFVDALIEFDLRTAVPGGPPKWQSRWLAAAYESFVQKGDANYQIQVGLIFPYRLCEDLNGPKALDLVAQGWLGCKPLIDLLHDGYNARLIRSEKNVPKMDN